MYFDGFGLSAAKHFKYCAWLLSGRTVATSTEVLSPSHRWVISSTAMVLSYGIFRWLRQVVLSLLNVYINTFCVLKSWLEKVNIVCTLCTFIDLTSSLFLIFPSHQSPTVVVVVVLYLTTHLRYIQKIYLDLTHDITYVIPSGQTEFQKFFLLKKKY